MFSRDQTQLTVANTMYCIKADSFQQWRTHTRQLLMRAVPPQHIAWQQKNQSELNFGDSEGALMALDVQVKQPCVPREFLDMAEEAACYRDDKRWALFYSLAWRLVFEDKNLLAFKID